VFRRLTRTAFLAGAAIAALAVAQPAAAFTEIGTRGTVGAHSLQDTAGNPGADCRLKYSAPNGAFKLVHISVQPPRMKAVPGMGAEDVAWSFTVQRRIVRSGAPGPWKARYTSQKFRSSTNSRHNADFGQFRGVRVEVPFASGGRAAAEYRVMVRLFWYQANGTTLLGRATERVQWYYPDIAKSGVSTYHGFCPDYD
jgi:hypothetical protein